MFEKYQKSNCAVEMNVVEITTKRMMLDLVLQAAVLFGTPVKE